MPRTHSSRFVRRFLASHFVLESVECHEPTPPGSSAAAVDVLTHTADALRALMARFDLSVDRSLGQHFLADPATVRYIAALSGVGSGDRVVEIGAGLGSLTLALAETGASVLAVEVDAGLAVALRYVVAETPLVEVMEGDARAIDFNALLPAAGHWRLVANLPYNIATPLVLDLLRYVPTIGAMVVMLQREPAERLAAPPGSKTRGIPSVLVERYGTARVVATVPPSVFVPRPSVESAILRIDRHISPLRIDRHISPGPLPSVGRSGSVDRFEHIVRTAFGQRRKMLRRSLAGEVPTHAFNEAGVDNRARPESLTFEQWMALASAV